MRRPLVVIASSYGAGVLIAYLRALPLELSLILALGSGVLLLYYFLNNHKRFISKAFCLFLCAFSVGALLFSFQNFQFQNDMKRLNENLYLTGEILNVQKKDTDYYKIVLSDPVDIKRNIKFHFHVVVNVYGKHHNLERQQGKRIYAEVEASLPQSQRNPRTFHYQQYLKTQKVFAEAQTETVELSNREADLFDRVTSDIRYRFASRLYQSMDRDSAGLVIGMMFGDKTGLDEEIYADFQRNGTAHILAVSGLHMGILYGCLCLLYPRKKGAVFYSSVLIFLLIYVSLANFSPSVVRASAMIAIHLCAKIFHCRYDLLSSAAFTFILMLINNPMQLFHAGFQLSFLAILSLAVLEPGLKQSKLKLFKNSTVSATAAIQLGMTPYTAYLFNYVSLSSIVSNIPIIFLAGILIPLGVFLMILSFLPGGFFALGAAVLEVGCRALIWINRFTYNEGKYAFDVTSPSALWLLIYYMTVFFLFSEKGRILTARHNWRQLATVLISIVFCATLVSSWVNSDFDKAELMFVDVGQGDCLLIRTEEGKHYLVDGGGKFGYDVGTKLLKPFLLKNGVDKIDIAFVTHLHMDHYAGIKSLAKEGMIDKLAVYEGNQVISKQIARETGLRETDLIYLYGGQQVTLAAETSIQILYPPRETEARYEEMVESAEDENASSLIMKVNHRGTRILMTGDIGTEAEDILVDTYGKGLESEVLKIAHHGSKYSTGDAFLDAVNPRLAVIQVGKNNFGHPAEGVIEKCLQKGIMVYRNDINGAVGLRFDKKDGIATIKTMID